MSRLDKKIIIALFAFLFVAPATVLAVQSGGNIPLESLNAIQGVVDCAQGNQNAACFVNGGITQTGQTTKYNFGLFSSQLGGLNNLLTGWTLNNNGVAHLGPPYQGEQVAFASSGALGSTTSLVAAVIYPRVSFSIYMADLIQNIKNPLGAQTAYAQGLGFSSLEPVLGLWKIMRNVAYFFFVVIFLFVGFAIMLRSKIGGQAAVTIQQALPKLVISLLLVTFSYAIAGLAIDIMYVVIYLFIGIFSSTNVPGMLASDLSKAAFQNNILFNIIAIMANGVVGQVGAAVQSMVSGMLQQFAGVSGTVGDIAGSVINVVVSLILVIALLVNMFRLFFALLKAYAGVFISVIFAPIQLLIGALPGQNTFSAWFMGLVENLAAFPVVILMLFIAFYFSNSNGGLAGQITGKGIGGFSAPQLGSNQGTGGTIALAMLEFGIISMIPSAVEIAKKAVHGKLDIDVGKTMGDVWKQGRGKAIVGALAGAPFAGVGAVTGYKYATDRANKLGLEGRARTLAQLGGVVGGGGIGLNLPSTIRHVAPAALRQIAQTQITESSKEIQQAAETRRAEAEAARQAQIIEHQKAQQSAAGRSPVPPGPKPTGLSGLR
ncbi:MAG TPA: hypothetical protein VLH19_01090 [Patescibacteria group bacterium]|nr:hypothetical protein [Patescibacteria group bacterium]